MKKFPILMGTLLMIGLIACGGSIDSKIDKVAQLAKEAQEIETQMANGDNSNSEKLTKISIEMAKIASELDKEELTQEQKEKLTKAALGM